MEEVDGGEETICCQSFLNILYTLVRVRWVGIIVVFLALVSFSVTLPVCYTLRNDGNHTNNINFNNNNNEDEGLPTISDLGLYMPEHAVFATGFTIVAILIAMGMILRFAHISMATRGSEKCEGGNVILIIIGLAHAPPLIAMATVRDFTNPIHFYMALIALGILGVYCIGQAFLSLALTFPPPHNTPLAVTWLRRGVGLLWYLPLAVASPVLVVLWVSSGMNGGEQKNIYEWLGVGCLFLYFLPLIFEFWYAPNDDKARTKYLMEKDGRDEESHQLLVGQ